MQPISNHQPIVMNKHDTICTRQSVLKSRCSRSCFKLASAGFTLVEVITVMVILGIVAAIGSHFVVSTIDSYDEMQQRTKLVAKGRLVIEQMTRQLREALPNGLRVSSSGDCVEFLPMLVGANYEDLLPDASNSVAATTSITTIPFSFSPSSGTMHVVVAALNDGEIYSTGSPNSRVTSGSFSALASYSSIPLGAAHTFLRNSISRRVYITEDPKRFCVSGTDLVMYFGYGLNTGTLGDTDPGGSSAIMAQDIAASGSAFSLSSGSVDRNAILAISLQFNQGRNQVVLEQQVMVRNVP